MREDQIQRRIKKKVRAKKGFLIHFGIYLACGLFFLALNIATFSPLDGVWFFFPMIPWGLGILIHYLAAFGFPGTEKLVKKWEHEETIKELAKLHMDETPTPRLKKPTLRPLPKEEEFDLESLQRQKEKLYDEEDFV